MAGAAREEAERLHAEEDAASAAIAAHGADLLAGARRIATHCNTGALAAGGRGTALAVILELEQRGAVHVLAGETRPLLQGARLTVWELARAGVSHDLVVDGAMAGLIRRGEVDAAIVGADRVAANGDTANKVGTYPLALAAAAAGIPFVVAAPTSTIDAQLPDGDGIEIEERDADEVRAFAGVGTTLPGTGVRNPAFDVTPAGLITALVTERGVARPPDAASIARSAGMRVARSLTPREVRVEQAADPEPGSGDVVCRVLACGVCGSDVLDAWVARKVPTVLGHELAGEVIAVGHDVAGVVVGDRVVVHHHAPCGECRRCRRGHETLCERFKATALDPGGFAERVRVPADLVDELLVLDGLDAERATFVEPLACVLRAFERCGLRAGDSLLVVGCGTSGLLAIAAAHARAVEAVWAREPRPERLERALALGAERHGNELVDVVMVCTPKPDAIAAGFAAVAPGGALCLYAPPDPGHALGLDGHALYVGEVDVCASYSAGPGDMRAALRLIAGGQVDPLPFVTHRVGLDETGRALELARSGEAIKVLVAP